MPTAHIVTTKEFTFRGLPERFSNGYNFQIGTNPMDETFLASLAHAVRDWERTFHANDIRFVYLLAGQLGEDAIWTEEVGQSGPLGQATTAAEHPENCLMAESKKKNRVYLRKFYHTGTAQSGISGSRDAVSAPLITATNTVLAKLTDGTLPGAVKACFPNGDLAIAPFTTDPYIRTRQLKRRGRRPTP